MSAQSSNLVSQIEAWRRDGDDVDAMRNMLAELALPGGGQVIIFWGETEASMLKDLEAHGLVPAAEAKGNPS